MRIINYISIIAMPLVILIIVFKGIKEKVPVFDIFLKGATEGIEITLKIFPTLIGLFVAIGMLRSSGILDFITKLISPFLAFLRFPVEIVPLALLRPISGSSSTAIGTNLMQKFGTDSDIGILISTDPVAIDQACIDLVYSCDDEKKDHLIQRIESRNGILTIKASAELGFGSREYELIKVD